MESGLVGRMLGVTVELGRVKSAAPERRKVEFMLTWLGSLDLEVARVACVGVEFRKVEAPRRLCLVGYRVRFVSSWVGSLCLKGCWD